MSQASCLKKTLLPPQVSQRSRELFPGVSAPASPAASDCASKVCQYRVYRLTPHTHTPFFFSTPPHTKLACFLLLALKQLHPADTLRVF